MNLTIGGDLEAKLKSYSRSTGIASTTLVKTWIAEKLVKWEVPENFDPEPKQEKRVKPNEFIAYFSDQWKLKYGESYSWTKKDVGIAAQLAKRMDFDDLRAACQRYFADDQSFIVKQAHPVSFFEARVNAYRAERLSALERFKRS